MLSVLILLRHASAATTAQTPVPRLESAGRQRAAALADVLQLYNPTILLSAPDQVCTDTLAPLAKRLGVKATTSADLAADLPKFPTPDGARASAAHGAAWLAARAVRALPDSRRTAVVCADGNVLAALLVAVAARDDHDLSSYPLDLPLESSPAATLLPGGGWILHRDDGRLLDVKTLAAP